MVPSYCSGDIFKKLYLLYLHSSRKVKPRTRPEEEIQMKRKFENALRRLAERLLRMQRYRYLRAHVWDDAVHNLTCGGRCA